MKRSVIIISLFLTLLLTRLFLINESKNVTLYITFINSISLIIVYVSIIEATFISLKNIINQREVPLQIKNNMIKDVKFKKNITYLFILLLFIGIKLSSDTYNDAISIFTIAISLLDKEVSSAFLKLIRKWCRL